MLPTIRPISGWVLYWVLWWLWLGGGDFNQMAAWQEVERDVESEVGRNSEEKEEEEEEKRGRVVHIREKREKKNWIKNYENDMFVRLEPLNQIV